MILLIRVSFTARLTVKMLFYQAEMCAFVFLPFSRSRTLVNVKSFKLPPQEPHTAAFNVQSMTMLFSVLFFIIDKIRN